MQNMDLDPSHIIDRLVTQLMSDPLKCRSEARKIRSQINEEDTPLETAQLLYIEAVGAYYQSRIEEAIQILNQILPLFSDLENIHREALHWTMRTQIALALCYRTECDFARSIYLLMEAHDQAQKENDNFIFSYCLTYLGEAYTAIGRINEALDYLQSAEQSPEAEKTVHLKGITNLYLGSA